MSTETPTAAELRASVQAFRWPKATEWQRTKISEWWASLGIPNQFAAMLRAAEAERTEEAR